MASLRSFGLVETSSEGYMLTIVDRGADTLFGLGQIGEDAAAALRAEARRRLAAGRFFGHIAYVGLVARKAPVRAGVVRRSDATKRGRSQGAMRDARPTAARCRGYRAPAPRCRA